ncbi:hypothetical protein HDV06_001939 [Boothiomyces sp. JEL0866]|nr:hypothetical protein HDV06_001939 [Boothiomyces sp. JEL0866]
MYIKPGNSVNEAGLVTLNFNHQQTLSGICGVLQKEFSVDPPVVAKPTPPPKTKSDVYIQGTDYSQKPVPSPPNQYQSLTNQYQSPPRSTFPVQQSPPRNNPQFQQLPQPSPPNQYPAQARRQGSFSQSPPTSMPPQSHNNQSIQYQSPQLSKLPEPVKPKIDPAVEKLHQQRKVLKQKLKERIEIFKQNAPRETDRLKSLNNQLLGNQKFLDETIVRLQQIESGLKSNTDVLQFKKQELVNNINYLKTIPNIDDQQFKYPTVLHQQYVDLTVENYAIEDTIYYLSKKFSNSSLKVQKLFFLDTEEWINNSVMLSLNESEKSITLLDCQFSLQNSMVLHLPNKQFWFKIISDRPIRFIASLEKDDLVLFIILERMLVNIKKVDDDQFAKMNNSFAIVESGMDGNQIQICNDATLTKGESQSCLSLAGIDGYPVMDSFSQFDYIVEKRFSNRLLYLVNRSGVTFWMKYSSEWPAEYQDKVREFETKVELPSVIDTASDLQEYIEIARKDPLYRFYKDLLDKI